DPLVAQVRPTQVQTLQVAGEGRRRQDADGIVAEVRVGEVAQVQAAQAAQVLRPGQQAQLGRPQLLLGGVVRVGEDQLLGAGEVAGSSEGAGPGRVGPRAAVARPDRALAAAGDVQRAEGGQGRAVYQVGHGLGRRRLALVVDEGDLPYRLLAHQGRAV